MENKKYKLSDENYGIIRDFFKSLPQLDILPDNYRKMMIPRLIMEMILQERGSLIFESLIDDGDFETYACIVTAFQWIYDNIDIWEYRRVYDNKKLEGIMFRLKKDGQND